jgi:hypothetical protein
MVGGDKGREPLPASIGGKGARVVVVFVGRGGAGGIQPQLWLCCSVRGSERGPHFPMILPMWCRVQGDAGYPLSLAQSQVACNTMIRMSCFSRIKKIMLRVQSNRQGPECRKALQTRLLGLLQVKKFAGETTINLQLPHRFQGRCWLPHSHDEPQAACRMRTITEGLV